MPSRHGVHDWNRGGNYGPDAAIYLEGQTGYTDLLAQAGWTCGISGKWHLGNSVLPQHGFSHWFVHEKGGGEYNDAPMIRDGELFNGPGYVTNVITDDALAFIDRHVGDAAPFYLSVHYTAPHSPWTGHPQAIVDSYDDCILDRSHSCPQEEPHPWANWLTANCLGNRDIQGLLRGGHRHGPRGAQGHPRAHPGGIHQRTTASVAAAGFWGKGNGTSPLNMYENSSKVPFLASHPGRIPHRTGDRPDVQRRLHAHPAAYAGVDFPEALHHGRPRRSFAGLLEGAAAPARDRVVIYDEYGATRMIRTAEWKYVPRYPAAGIPAGPNELYDLVTTDPDERTNRIDDPAQQRRIRDLRGPARGCFAEQVSADQDGRTLPVGGGGQLRPVGPAWEDGSPAFTANDCPPSAWWRDK